MIGNETFIRRFALILAGVLLSVIGAMIWTQGGYQKDGLLHLGKIQKLNQSELSPEGVLLNQEGNRYEVCETEAGFTVNLSNDSIRWGVCVFYLKDVNKPYWNWNVDFCDKKGNIIQQGTCIAKNGKISIEIPGKKKISVMKIRMDNAAGASFRVVKAELREKDFDGWDFLKKTLVLCMGCVVLYILVRFGKRIGWYAPIDMLQTFFIAFGDMLGKRIAGNFGERTRKRMQIFISFVIFLLMIIMNNVEGPYYEKDLTGWMFVFGFLIMLCALLSWKVPLKKLNWKNGYCFSWFLLWLMVCISDLFCAKNVSYVGQIMIFIGGFAIFVWNNARSFHIMMKRMLAGLEWTLLPVLIYCCLFRQKSLGILYNGCFLQNDSMAMYALSLFAAFLTDLNFDLKKKQCSHIKFVLRGAGAAVSLSLLYYSRTMWCMAAAVGILVVCVVSVLKYLWSCRERWKEIAGLSAVTLLCGLLLVVGVKYAISNLPETLGTQIVYENEVKKTHLTEELMQALEAWQPGSMSGVQRQTDKVQLARMYIQGLNITGHEENLIEDNAYIELPNGIMQIAFRYGMLIVIPYVLIFVQGSYIEAKKRDYLGICVVFSFFILTVFENVEIAFAQPAWLFFYLWIGRRFGNGWLK